MRTYANFAYMQNLLTYANLVMCTRLNLDISNISENSISYKKKNIIFLPFLFPLCFALYWEGGTEKRFAVEDFKLSKTI